MAMEYASSNGLKNRKLLPKERLVLDIKKGKDIDERVINITAYGNRYIELLKELEEN